MNYPKPKPQAIVAATEPPSPGNHINKRPMRLKSHRLALIRRADLIALAHSRQARGLPVDTEAFLRVAAFSIAALEGMPQPTHRRHDGLDIVAARAFVVHAGIDMDDEHLWPIVKDVSDRISFRKSSFKMTAPLAGRLVQLTREERDNLRIKTMEAIDEPAAARRVRKAQEKRVKDRERQRNKRATLAGSKTPQTSIERAKPWSAEGISRRTWYRRRATARDDGFCSPSVRCPAEHRTPSGTDFVADLSHKGIRDISSVTSVTNVSCCPGSAVAETPQPTPKTSAAPTTAEETPSPRQGEERGFLSRLVGKAR